MSTGRTILCIFKKDSPFQISESQHLYNPSAIKTPSDCPCSTCVRTSHLMRYPSMTESSTISRACATVPTCCASPCVLLACKYFVCACVMCMGYGRCDRWDVWINMCVCVHVCLCEYLHVWMCSCVHISVCMYNVVKLWWLNSMLGTSHNTVAHATNSDTYTHIQKDMCCSVHLPVSLKYTKTH